MSVESFLKRENIEVDRINIDGDEERRQELIELNKGYASVPTLIFPDGSKLVEPSLGELRHKLVLEASPGLMQRVRSALARNSERTE